MAKNSNGIETSNTSSKLNSLVSLKLKRLHNEILQNTQISNVELFGAYRKSIKGSSSTQNISTNPPIASNESQLIETQSLPVRTQSAPTSSTLLHFQNFYLSSALVVLSILIAIIVVNPLINFLLGIRCFVPNNYLIWEATRPISDCQYCHNIHKPLILPNITRQEFLVIFSFHLYANVFNMYVI